MARLLPPPLIGVYRDLAALTRAGASDGVPFVVNGWLGDPTPMDENCFFAGVFLGGRDSEQLAWIRQSRFAVGARDPHTQGRLEEAGIASEMIGCATLTLPKHRGPRQGTLFIEADGPADAERSSMDIGDIPWPSQWQMARELLDRLRRAALVFTSRLHVALPCLSMGTPVVVSAECRRRVWQGERFTLLDYLGFRYGEPNVIDVTPVAERFKAFLSASLDL